MCGIVGYVGPDEALPILLEGLRRLEYRGYDSAGVAVLDDAVAVIKRAGKLSELDAALAAGEPISGRVGMGHTRWATHGAPTDENAHPHLDCSARFAVIHNGIIEHFSLLRNRLEQSRHAFTSETDTEVVAHLLEEAFQGSLADAVRAVIRDLTGAYALVVASSLEPDVIVGVKVSSPLLVGLGEGENLLASGQPAFMHRTKRFVALDEGQVVEVRADVVRITDFDGNEMPFEPATVNWDLAAAEKGGYEDFMLKEIHEQPTAVRSTSPASSGIATPSWTTTP